MFAHCSVLSYFNWRLHFHGMIVLKLHCHKCNQQCEREDSSKFCLFFTLIIKKVFNHKQLFFFFFFLDAVFSKGKKKKDAGSFWPVLVRRNMVLNRRKDCRQHVWTWTVLVVSSELGGTGELYRLKAGWCRQLQVWLTTFADLKTDDLAGSEWEKEMIVYVCWSQEPLWAIRYDGYERNL